MYRLNTEKRFGLRDNAIPGIILDEQIGEEALASAGIRWIIAAAGENRFHFYGLESEKCFESIKKCAGTDCPPQEKIRALKEFATLLVNNPYCCENGCYDRKSTDYIISDVLVCFFVECSGVCVPIGALKDCFGIDVKGILSKFLQAKNTAFTNDLKCVYEVCTNVISCGNSALIRRKRIMWPTLVLFVLFLVSFVLGYNGFITGVQWQNASAVFSSGANFIQSIGLLTSQSYGINPNSTLPLLLLADSFLGLCISLGLIKPVFLGVRAYVTYTHLIIQKKKCSGIVEKTQELIDSYQRRNAYVSYNMEHLPSMRLDLENSQLGHTISQMINDTGSLPKMPKGVSSLPKATGLVVLALILSVLCVFNSVALTDFFIGKYNMYSVRCSEYIHSKELKASELFCVSGQTEVYTSDDEKAMVICTLMPETFFEILETAQDRDNTYHIRFRTKVGFVSGWIKGVTIRTVNPFEQMSIEKLEPFEVTSSSGNDKIQRLTDESKYTSWRGQSSEDKVEIEFNYQTPVSAQILRFNIGNFFTNWYTAKDDGTVNFTVEFSCGGSSVGKIKAELSEKLGDQFIHLNKSVTVDRVCFSVENITENGKSNTPYITELGVYSEKQEQ